MKKLGYDHARHLLTRAGFGPRTPEIEAFAALTPRAAARRLLSGVRTTATRPLPAWTSEVPLLIANRRQMMMAANKRARRQMRRKLQQKGGARGVELKGWWLQEMIATPSPLTEKLTLFWHNHFTSSLRKVKSPVLLARQNALLRQHAAGNFRTLLHAVAKDPAMIAYLDGRNSRVGDANENFARELLELFTLGEGHYTERDIKEAARAFTGWHIHQQTGAYRFVMHQHDWGEKTFMGKTGTLKGEDVLNVVLEQPRVATYLVEKLWRTFASPTPPAAEVARLAAILRASKYELKPVLQAMFEGAAFYAPGVLGAQIKSPVELIIGTVRTFGVTITDPKLLMLATRRLGQDVFDPPNVKGWPGGQEWITSTTLLARQQILTRLFRDPGNMPALARQGFAALHGPARRGQNAIQQTQRLLLPMAPVHPLGGRTEAFEVARHLVLDPTYQLI